MAVTINSSSYDVRGKLGGSHSTDVVALVIRFALDANLAANNTAVICELPYGLTQVGPMGFVVNTISATASGTLDIGIDSSAGISSGTYTATADADTDFYTVVGALAVTTSTGGKNTTGNFTMYGVPATVATAANKGKPLLLTVTAIAAQVDAGTDCTITLLVKLP